jgi:hypothetical protein
LKRELDSTTELLQQELERLDEDKISDFQQTMEEFLKGFLETQQQTLALWTSYFERGGVS